MTREIPISAPAPCIATFYWEPSQYFEGYGTKPGYWALESVIGTDRELTADERDEATEKAYQYLYT